MYDADSEKFFIRGRDSTTKGYKMKLCEEIVKNDLKKYFYSIKVLDECNKMNEDKVNANNMQKFQKLYGSREWPRDRAL